MDCPRRVIGDMHHKVHNCGHGLLNSLVLPCVLTEPKSKLGERLTGLTACWSLCLADSALAVGAGVELTFNGSVDERNPLELPLMTIYIEHDELLVEKLRRQNRFVGQLDGKGRHGEVRNLG
jgi:hypothetical protein